jgi:flagellar protein FliS
MANLVYDNYLKDEVLNADPVKLVTILFRAAIEAVGAARKHLANGSIHERSRQITKAFEIIGELRSALNHDAGGEISVRLAALYVYMQQRLLEANCKQADPPLEEVEKLLATLLEGWYAIRTEPPERSEEYVPLSCAC